MHAEIASGSSRVHIDRVVTISISPVAFASTLPAGAEADARPNGKGDYAVTLDRNVVEHLAAMRRPGEGYSDVIQRLAGVRASEMVLGACFPCASQAPVWEAVRWMSVS
jgi:hypothetical protein